MLFYSIIQICGISNIPRLILHILNDIYKVKHKEKVAMPRDCSQLYVAVPRDYERSLRAP